MTDTTAFMTPWERVVGWLLPELAKDEPKTVEVKEGKPLADWRPEYPFAYAYGYDEDADIQIVSPIDFQGHWLDLAAERFGEDVGRVMIDHLVLMYEKAFVQLFRYSKSQKPYHYRHTAQDLAREIERTLLFIETGDRKQVEIPKHIRVWALLNFHFFGWEDYIDMMSKELEDTEGESVDRVMPDNFILSL